MILRKHVALLFFILISSCTYFEPIKGSVVNSRFEACPNSHLVYYQGSAETLCDKTVPKVNKLVSEIERAHGKPFTEQVVIHLCDTVECFDKYTGVGTNIKAAVSSYGLFLSPKLFDKVDYEKFVAHELSHLHLFQQISKVDAYLIPQWFHDGMATYASQGGGADGVSIEEATDYLREGKCIVANEKSPIIGQRWPINYKERGDPAFQQRMNYRQSALFVEFLDKEGRIQALLRKIESGNNFSDSFESVYHEPIQSSWVRFVSKIKS